MNEETYQPTHEAIIPEVEHSGIPDIRQRSKVVIFERFRNELIRGFLWNHILAQACLPFSQSVQFRSDVFSLLRSDLRSL